MTRKTIIVSLLLIITNEVMSQARIPHVPADIVFAEMQLHLTEAARRDIQKDVNALWTSPKYLEIKADRARLYFPIIEKTLLEAGVHGDFKFLALQESALISDAVSSSNAVGFWQFKDFTGREVGLRIDKSIDERLNVVASTYGAAKYFKRHNFFFDNWVYTLLAHMTGKGGAMKYVDKDKFGEQRMTLNGKTHWYVKRFLAHKIAYENAVKGVNTTGLKLVIYKQGGGKSLAAIAKQMKIEETELKKYNKWLKTSKIPTETTYYVILPVRAKAPRIKDDHQHNAKTDALPFAKARRKLLNKTYPSLTNKLNVDGTIFIKINQIPCILANKGDNITSLANKAKISTIRFAKYNDLKTSNPIIYAGAVYYLKPKHNKSKIYYHTVQKGESLWEVAQKFGIKKAKLAKLNRMMIADELIPGRLLWLHTKRPVTHQVEYQTLPQLTVDEAIPPQKKVIKVDHKERKAQAQSPAPYESAPTKQSVSYHLVLKGQTLYSIAKLNNVTVANLVEWNQLYNHALKIGQKLILHGANTAPTTKPTKQTITLHLVAPGDTIYSISRQYNIPVPLLLKLNQKDNFDLTIGEKLRVKE